MLQAERDTALGFGGTKMQLASHQDRLLDLIYRRSMGEPWNPFLRQLRASTGSVLSAVMYTADSRHGPHLSGDVADHDTWLDMERINRLYGEKYWRLEPVHPVNMLDGSIHAQTWESAQTTEFYQKFIRANGLGPSLYARFSAPNGEAWWLAISRRTDDPGFSESDRSLCRSLLPHLRRSLQLGSQLQKVRTENAVYGDTLNHLGVAVLILDHEGRVVSSNGADNATSTRYRCFTVQANRLQFHQRAAQMKLREFLRRLPRCDVENSRSLCDTFRAQCDDGHILCISLSTSRNPRSGSDPTRSYAVVRIRETQRAVTCEQSVLGQLYGLTPRESEIAIAIANGRSLGEIAVASRRSMRTIRNHLQGVFSKTRTRRQAELAKLVIRSVD